MHRLLAGIRRHQPGAGTQVTEASECPYLGLCAFQAEDVHRFFGREALTEWLIDSLRVDDSRFWPSLERRAAASRRWRSQA